MRQYENYTAFDYDTIKHGSEIKIDHTIYCEDIDLTDLISQPLEKIQFLRAESKVEETKAFDNVKQAAEDWEAKAAITSMYDRAISYLKVPETEHSSNEWVKGHYWDKKISNKVYQMSYNIYEYKSYRTNNETRWELKWYVSTNSPQENSNIQIAGQEKSFTSKEAMEKYLQGRIKAYSHLFTENSPPIPKEHIKPFILYGHLLPGYTEVGEIKKDIEVKPSVRAELKSLAEKNKSAPKKSVSPKRTEQEI